MATAEVDLENDGDDVSDGGQGKYSDVLFNYNVHETIGAGSFGKVKKATKKSTGDVVAIKIIDKSLIGDVEDVMRYTREFAILANLNHKNIIRLHEVTQNDSHFYVIMDLCLGNLADIVARDGVAAPPELNGEEDEGTPEAPPSKPAKNVLPEDVARGYFRQVVAGIEHSHKRNVIHRDIKLDNVLEDMDGNLRVCDFGLSAMVDDADTMLKTQVGTLHFAAPEILKGKGYVGSPVDVWSLGVMLYVMVVGKYPFSNMAKQQKEVKRAILSKSPPLPKNISRGIRDLIARMLTKDPERRITLSQVQNHSWYLGMSIERDPPSPYSDPSVFDDEELAGHTSTAPCVPDKPNKETAPNPKLEPAPQRRPANRRASTTDADFTLPADPSERARMLRIKRHSLTGASQAVNMPGPLGRAGTEPRARKNSTASMEGNDDGKVWDRLAQSKSTRARGVSQEAGKPPLRGRRASLE